MAQDVFDKLMMLAKRRGFIYPSFEIFLAFFWLICYHSRTLIYKVLTMSSENMNEKTSKIDSNLAETVSKTTLNYLDSMKGQRITNLHNYVLEQIEPALLEVVMNYTRNNNQSEAAKILGLSRGTTRKLLKEYFGSTYCSSRDQESVDGE